MNKNIDINTLVSKLLTGEISEEEGKELCKRLRVYTLPFIVKVLTFAP